VLNGSIEQIDVTDAGFGYVNNPAVTISDTDGTGARAMANIANGKVTTIQIMDPGNGYTSSPMIIISPPPFPERMAVATAKVVNGFVVGIDITDGGFGYPTPPIVILSGDGSGATAAATVKSSFITTINIINPGSGYTSAPKVSIASPPFSPQLSINLTKVFLLDGVVVPGPRIATAIAQVVNGFVVGGTIVDSGFGYYASPVVTVSGGGGNGAIAVAKVVNGIITGITITNPGSGYTFLPDIDIHPPAFAPEQVGQLGVQLKVLLGSTNSLESSDDLNVWYPTGNPFVAQDEQLVQKFFVGTTNRYFRITEIR
jgi:hypothetical protein